MKKEIRFFLRDLLINRHVRRQLRSERFSILASDCIGGMLYKDLQHRMDSPTINMFFSASDYIKFCANLDHYLAQKIECDDAACAKADYPVGKLDDLTLHLVHYQSVEEAQAKWDERKQRLQKDVLYLMMNDRNGCTEKDIAAFDALPYQNKVIFTHKPYPQYSSAYCIPGSEEDEYIKITTAYLSPLSVKRVYDDFDVASWLNEGILKRRR